MRFKEIYLDILKISEAVILSLLFILISSLVFGDVATLNLFWTHHAFWFFPLIVWCAARFGQVATATMIFAVASMAIWKTAFAEVGPFVERNFYDNVFVLNCFLGVFSGTGLTLAAATRELTSVRWWA